MKRLPLFLLALALLASFWGCDQVKEPEFKEIKNLKFNSVNLKGVIRLTGDAIFENPNPVGIDITGLDLKVDIEGNESAAITQSVTAQMKANSDFSLPLNIDIPAEKVVRNLKNTLGSLLGDRKYEVRIAGTIEVSLLGQKVKVPMDYQEKAAIPLKLL